MYSLDSQQLENASVMVDALRCEFHRIGRGELARQLKGVEITCPQSAELALMLICSLPHDARTTDVCRAAEEILRAASHQIPLAS